MSDIRKKRLPGLITVSILLSLMLLATTSCIASNESPSPESVLENLGAMDGQATFLTKDGETVTVTVTKGTQTDVESTSSNTTTIQEKESSEDKDGAASESLADILPSLDCIEDVFKALGVWDEAAELYKNSLSWSHVAGELGYDKDRMYSELEEDIEERLHHAMELELISQSQFEYKYNFFCEKALKWVDKIFADTGEDSSESLDDILPSLDGVEDVFNTLGIWEDAVDMYKKGLTWSLIAGELGYDKNKMYHDVEAIIEERLSHARELGLINQDQFEYKFTYFSDKAIKWINMIFTDSYKYSSENLDDILPSLDCIEDVFKTLGVWEDAAYLQKQGLTWSHIAEEMGYDKYRMYSELEEIIEERLHNARDLDLIDQDQLEYKYDYFCEKALKWINKIFST